MQVLIADDEPDVRMGLKAIIDWNSLGCEICGEAANGEECLKKILALNPDLVLLDIRMPKMHGLECAKTAREKGWNGKIIILSGYSDFQYAQNAIQCNVEKYLLKPIDEDELIQSVIEIRKKMEKEHQQSQQINLVFEKARNTVLSDILCGKMTQDNNRVHVNGLNLRADSYLVVIPEKDRKNSSDPYIWSKLRKLLQTPDVEKIAIHETDVYLLKGTKSINKFDDAISNAQTDGIFVAVGRTVDTIEDVPLSFQDAKAVYSRRFFYHKNQTVVRKEDLPPLAKTNNINGVNLHDYVEKLCTLIQVCNFKSVCTLLDGLYKRLTTMDVLPDYAVNILINIQIQVENSIVENYKQGNLKTISDAEIIAAFSNKKRLYEIFDVMKDSFSQLINSIISLQGNHLADRIKIYIENNYNKNLKLEILAQTFGYNSAYLGKIFKNSIGENFNSYLDRIRISKAKELLECMDSKVYEISKKVGYENIDYFYIKFHKYVGQSPLEYRKSVQSQKNTS